MDCEKTTAKTYERQVRMSLDSTTGWTASRLSGPGTPRRDKDLSAMYSPRRHVEMIERERTISHEVNPLLWIIFKSGPVDAHMMPAAAISRYPIPFFDPPHIHTIISQPVGFVTLVWNENQPQQTGVRQWPLAPTSQTYGRRRKKRNDMEICRKSLMEVISLALPKKVLVILNPVAGHGKAKRRLPAVRSALAQSGIPYDVVETERRGHAAEISAAAAKNGYDILAAMGGDGTLSEVVNGLAAREEGTETR